MLILLLIVSSLYFFRLQRHYQIHTKIQDHQFIVTEIIFQNKAYTSSHVKEKRFCSNEDSLYSKYRYRGLYLEKLVATREFTTLLNTAKNI